MKTERREFLKKIFGGGTLTLTVIIMVPAVLSGGRIIPPTTSSSKPTPKTNSKKKKKSIEPTSADDTKTVDLNGSKGITGVSEDDRAKGTKQKK